jgi:hypothetical protein
MPNLLLLQEAQLSAGQSSSCWTEAIYKLLVPVQRIFLFFSSSCKSCRALKAALREASCHSSISLQPLLEGDCASLLLMMRKLMLVSDMLAEISSIPSTHPAISRTGAPNSTKSRCPAKSPQTTTTTTQKKGKKKSIRRRSSSEGQLYLLQQIGASPSSCFFRPALLSSHPPLPPTYTNSLHKIPNPIKRILAT